jgi:hypothetical protein
LAGWLLPEVKVGPFSLGPLFVGLPSNVLQVFVVWLLFKLLLQLQTWQFLPAVMPISAQNSMPNNSQSDKQTAVGRGYFSMFFLAPFKATSGGEPRHLWQLWNAAFIELQMH